MAFNLAPLIRQRHLDANGNPLAGGKLYTYQAGTSTPQATYTDSGGLTANANPVVLDANGEANVWTDVTLSYKFVLTDSSDVEQWTVDNVIGLISNNAVATAALQDGAVTTAKLADDSVTAAKLKDSATIDADRAVTSDHIRDGAVTVAKIAAAARGFQILNGGLAASAASNALTISLKGADGNDPSATNPVYISFRNSTATDGTPVVRTVTSALSITVSSGSTLGHASGANQYVYVYLLDNAGAVELAVAGQAVFDEQTLQSTSGEGGAGAADSGTTLYSTTGRNDVPVRLFGRVKSVQATAGTWASPPTELSLSNGRGFKQIRSEIRLVNLAGQASVNTHIVYFTTTHTNTGTAMSLSNLSTTGTEITINEDGLYHIQFSNRRSGGASTQVGFSKNSTQLTTAIGSITNADIIDCAVATVSASQGGSTPASAMTYLRAKDVIRPHTDNTAADATVFGRFSITKISD